MKVSGELDFHTRQIIPYSQFCTTKRIKKKAQVFKQINSIFNRYIVIFLSAKGNCLLQAYKLE